VSASSPSAVRRGDRRALADALNATLGLDLADFGEAREFLRSHEGWEMLDAWLAAHLDDGEPNA
jgi:hypothetical protein